MVYPNGHISSEHGSRDVIDDNDIPTPFVITLIRQGSSDHIHPNFPTPGQIRSMFNTGKIGECPEYASSPSSMSDPAEWRPNNHIGLIEERLFRIQQWAENSLHTRPYEGNNVMITDLSESNENSVDDLIVGSDLDFNLQQTVFDVSDSIRVNLFNDDLETQSQVKYTPSNNIYKSDEPEPNQREFDVEEYVEQMNSNEGSDIISYLSNDKGHKKNDETIKLSEVIDRETYVRIKHIEKMFNLDINENDNSFAKELKSTLVRRIGDYMGQKDLCKNSSINDNVKDVAGILAETINENDALICQNVHELCLKLKDILKLKEDIMSSTFSEFNANEQNEIQPERDSFCIVQSDSAFSESSVSENCIYNVNMSPDQSEEKLQKDNFNERMKTSNYKVLPEFHNNTTAANYEPTDSFTTFSKIPVANQSKIKSNTYKILNGKNVKFQCPTKIPLYQPIPKCASNEKTDNITEINSDMSHKNSKSSAYKKTNVTGNSSKYTKGISQQKEELVKKATVLGLIDDENNLSSVSHISERAQLALLEKQIQGRMKNRQLALERKKTGLPETISKLQMDKSHSKDKNLVTQKISPLRHMEALTLKNIGNPEVQKNESKLENGTISKCSKSPLSTKNNKFSNDINEKSSTQTNEIISTDEIVILSKNLDKSLKEESPYLTMDSIEKPNEEKYIDNENNMFSNKIQSNTKGETGVPVLTAFIAPKEKIVNWDNDEITPHQSRESLPSNHRNFYKLKIGFAIIGIIIVLFGIAIYYYNPQTSEDCLKVYNEWIITLKETVLAKFINKHVQEIKENFL